MCIYNVVHKIKKLSAKYLQIGYSEFLLTGRPELLHFAPYTRDQIVKIIQDRLTAVSYNHLDILSA